MFFLGPSTLRTFLLVSLALLVAFLVTGFASSEYRSEKKVLGARHYMNGQELAAKGKMMAAVQEYREALLFQPENTDYRLSLATALINAGRLDEAQAHLEQLLQDDPTNGVINLLLARVALRRKHLKLAVEFYQRAVYEYWPASEIPQRRQARWELVDLLSKTGQRSALTAELIQLYASAPPDPKERAKIGFLLLNNGATSEAAQIFRDLTHQAPQDADAHLGLGKVDLASGDFIEARHEFQRALRLDPHNQDAAKSLALTNQIIDIDPALPSITSAEVLRRSQNLLTTVLDDLRACPVPQPEVEQEPSDGHAAVKAAPLGPLQTRGWRRRKSCWRQSGHRTQT